MVLDVKYVPRQVEKLNFHTNLDEEEEEKMLERAIFGSSLIKKY